MKNYISIALLISCILIFGISCGQKPHEENRSELTSQQQSTPGQEAESKPRLKGGGPRAGGRGYGRTKGKGMARTDGIQLSTKEKEAVNIQTAVVTVKSLNSQLSAMGKVMAPQQRKAIVSYAFPARISQVHVRIGDWIKTGTKLVTLQSEEVGNAKSEFYKAQSDYELAKISYERQRRLFDRGVGAQKDTLSAEADMKVAEANLNAAEKKLHVLGFSEAEVEQISEAHQINPIISLYAPISGKVIQNNAVLGDMIDQGTEILVIMDPTLLWIDAEIYEKDIAKVQKGQNVEITVPAYPGEKFHGITTYISDVLKEDTRTITVRAEIENQDQRLKPGMFADMKIALNSQAKTLVIPEEALLEDKGDKIVFVQRGDQYFLQVVETGTKENGFVEILRGVVQGDKVVTSGNYQLKSKLYEEILQKGHVH